MPINMKYCGLNDVRRLPASGPSSLFPRRPKSQKFKANILKLAGMVEENPYHMHRAAQELRSWVSDSYQPFPMLDVSFYTRCLQSFHSFQCKRPARKQVDPLDQMAGRRTVGLEPSLGPLRVNAPGQTSIIPSVSAESEFVYTMAAEMVQEHGYTWQQAISFSEQCWQRFPMKQKQAVASTAKDLDGNDAELCLDVENTRATRL